MINYNKIKCKSKRRRQETLATVCERYVRLTLKNIRDYESGLDVSKQARDLMLLEAQMTDLEMLNANIEICNRLKTLPVGGIFVNAVGHYR